MADGGGQGSAPDTIEPRRNGHQVFDPQDGLHQPRGGVSHEAPADGTKDSSMTEMKRSEWRTIVAHAQRLAIDHQTVEAIKLLRGATNCGIKEAYDEIKKLVVAPLVKS
jgi:ribosomal protein L7/L12